MSEPRWHEADSPNSRDGRTPGAPDRYPGAPRDTGPRPQRPDRPAGPRFTPNPDASWDDASATRRMPAPQEPRGGRGDGSRGRDGARDRRPDGPRGRGPRGRGPGGARGRDGARGPGGPGRAGRPRGGLAASFGSRPAAVGIVIIVASAVLGALVTIVQRRDPGTVLGVCVVLGTLVAGLAVRPRSAYVLLPVPALSYVGAAFIAGKIHDPTSTSRIDQLVHAGTWVADGFVSMVAATIVAVVVFGTRLFLDSRGNPRSPRSGGGPPRPGRPGPPRPGADDGTGRPRTASLPQYRPDGPGYGTGGTAPPYGSPSPYGSSSPYGSAGPTPAYGGSGPSAAYGEPGPYGDSGPYGGAPQHGPGSYGSNGQGYGNQAYDQGGGAHQYPAGPVDPYDDGYGYGSSGAIAPYGPADNGYGAADHAYGGAGYPYRGTDYPYGASGHPYDGNGHPYDSAGQPGPYDGARQQPGPYGADRPALPNPYRRELPPGR